MLTHDVQTQSRLLARLLRDVLAAESFETIADLADALRRRCSRLRITYTADEFAEALQWVGSNRSLVADSFAGLDRVPVVQSVAPDPMTIPAGESGRIYQQIMRRYRRDQGVTTVQTGDRPEHFPDLVRC